MGIFGGFRRRQFLGSAHHSAACSLLYLYGGKYQDHACGHVIRHADAMLARQWIGWSPRLWTSCWCQRDISLPGVVCSACTWLHAVGGPGRQRDRQGRSGRMTWWASCFLPFARTHAQVASTIQILKYWLPAGFSF